MQHAEEVVQRSVGRHTRQAGGLVSPLLVEPFRRVEFLRRPSPAIDAIVERLARPSVGFRSGDQVFVALEAPKLERTELDRAQHVVECECFTVPLFVVFQPLPSPFVRMMSRGEGGSLLALVDPAEAHEDVEWILPPHGAPPMTSGRSASRPAHDCSYVDSTPDGCFK